MPTLSSGVVSVVVAVVTHRHRGGVANAHGHGLLVHASGKGDGAGHVRSKVLKCPGKRLAIPRKDVAFSVVFSNKRRGSQEACP